MGWGPGPVETGPAGGGPAATVLPPHLAQKRPSTGAPHVAQKAITTSLTNLRCGALGSKPQQVLLCTDSYVLSRRRRRREVLNRTGDAAAEAKNPVTTNFGGTFPDRFRERRFPRVIGIWSSMLGAPDPSRLVVPNPGARTFDDTPTGK